MASNYGEIGQLYWLTVILNAAVDITYFQDYTHISCKRNKLDKSVDAFENILTHFYLFNVHFWSYYIGF